MWIETVALPGLGPRGVNPGLSRVRWSLGRKGVVWVSGLASTLGCVYKCYANLEKVKKHIQFNTAVTRLF